MIRYRTLKAPISVQLELTEQCTNNCIHCYNHWRIPGAKIKTLNKSQLHRILAQLIKHNVFSITLTGGESLTCKEILIEAIKELKKADIDIRLNSNLTLLSHDYAQELKGLFTPSHFIIFYKLVFINSYLKQNSGIIILIN